MARATAATNETLTPLSTALAAKTGETVVRSTGEADQLKALVKATADASLRSGRLTPAERNALLDAARSAVTISLRSSAPNNNKNNKSSLINNKSSLNKHA
eukprot:3825718-Pyramimonas_sp.AAC.1